MGPAPPPSLMLQKCVIGFSLTHAITFELKLNIEPLPCQCRACSVLFGLVRQWHDV